MGLRRACFLTGAATGTPLATVAALTPAAGRTLGHRALGVGQQDQLTSGLDGLSDVALVLLALLVVSAYSAYRRHQATDPLANLGQGLYQPPPDKNVVEYLPLPPTPTNAPPRK